MPANVDDKVDMMMFELDDDDAQLLPSIDSSHNFLNFSRKVTEASSMKRPVDIQLGIACGRDLVFSRSPFSFKPSPLAKPSPPIQTNIQTSATHVNNKDLNIITKDMDFLEKESIEKILPTIQFPYQNYQIQHMSSKKKTSPSAYLSTSPPESPVKSGPSSPYSLDQLVADVYSYMDSCPNQSPYSEDLKLLKPKLEAYVNTRPGM